MANLQNSLKGTITKVLAIKNWNTAKSVFPDECIFPESVRK